MIVFTQRTAYIFVFGMIFFTSIAQLLFKQAGLYSIGKHGVMAMWLTNYWFWFALFSMAMGTLSWLLALTKFSLSFAYPWTAMVYILTPLGSAFFYNDMLSLRYVVGMILIATGVFITSLEIKRNINADQLKK